MQDERPIDSGESLDDLTRIRLQHARKSLADSGFYAYVMLDDKQRWCVAADDEAGKIDITVEAGDYVVELSNSSPGLFVEEDSEWRRTALERLARRVVPNVSDGMLMPNQRASWSAEDHGVAVRSTFRIPFDQVGSIGPFCRSSLPDLDDLLTFVERQVTS